MPDKKPRDRVEVECLLQVREVQGSIPDIGRVIPKTLKEWYPWFPCLAVNIKRGTLALSTFSNSKKNIFEGLMEDWICQISSLVKYRRNKTNKQNKSKNYKISNIEWTACFSAAVYHGFLLTFLFFILCKSEWWYFAYFQSYFPGETWWDVTWVHSLFFPKGPLWDETYREV